VQASRAWRPPGGTLGTILEEVPARVAELSRRRDGLHARISQMPPPSSFVDALRGRTVAVIAEIKRRSPARGTIRTEISAAAQARAYDKGGAAAVSVLTEPVHFGGTSEDLSAAREATALPILKKDFHVDPVQLLEARSLGASAALLIARALPPEGLATMLREGERIGIETVVEIRDEEELERALEAGARIVGVNHRDLESLEIDFDSYRRFLITSSPSQKAASAAGPTWRGWRWRGPTRCSSVPSYRLQRTR
jgi:indole-3-glycerol phosphate synthase